MANSIDEPGVVLKKNQLPIWENEGGAVAPYKESPAIEDQVRDSEHYGRRVEADGTWTIYHVFTGVPVAGQSPRQSQL